MTEASPGLHQRIIQIHPTLTCNLRCTHCYSSSGPSMTSTLEVDRLCTVLSDAVELGYRTVAVSGGEPLLYRGLGRVLAHAKACGMRTALTTNATLLNERTLDLLRGQLDLMAISLDGPPEIHNQIRQSKHAFERLLDGLKSVRASGLRFGIIHTLTRQNWNDLLWTAQFAWEQGASLLQLHPLELSGRADMLMRGAEPDDDILARVYILSLALKNRYANSLPIQLDVFRKDTLVDAPELVYASAFDDQVFDAPAADRVGLLVVEADGAVVPISYGFSRQYAICNLRDQRLREGWPSYMQRGGYRAFRRLCQEVFEEVVAPSELPFFNWHELIVTRSHTSRTWMS